ncbi:MAG TPA: APC family permease [Candidatus Acidoferrales bacterium]|nr:APC family permease [Candidatus Acidoferrales bacterium]
MGRWTLTALVINSIIGSGIFGLPSVVAGYVGKQSPLAYLIAAAGIGVVIACFAEVASQFDAAGGPYLYAREAFGRFIGLQIGWLLLMVRLTAAAAAANLFTNYLAEYWPAVQEPVTRLSVLAVLIGFLAAANVRGIKSGAAASNVFTVAKLVPLILFAIAGGVFLLRPHPAIPGVLQSGTSVPIRNWLEAVLVLMFAYGGFEGAVIPMAETKDPQRDAPFALLVALVTVTILFFAIQYIVVAVLPGASMTDRPLTAAARQFLGTAGAVLISTGALISVCGFLTAQLLLAPRLTFALGEKGDFPPIFARIHSRFQTPHISILVFAAIIWCLSAAGSFTWNVFLSSIGRLFIYGFTCAALPVLRQKYPTRRAYRLPEGNLFAVLGVVFMLLLASRMNLGEGIFLLITMAIAIANWLWARNRQKAAVRPQTESGEEME